ncbi:MAG: undecaprenyldiphospho-muramoylpentapeptide beta-N-acetylglucosaminyltransferase [Bacteroidetes bacterium]|nr:undecaprenyldiphospho-muramoylpentapeptide beta-N-acetylglucosaminyltransferase [Bacteroidota bacterium]
MTKIKVIISGGGTGGHIFPAIAIANAIKLKYSDSEILFVGAEGKMEMEKIPAAGYSIVGLPIMGIQRKLTLQNLKVPFKLLFSLLKARKVIKEFKPDVVVGVGGYASGPLLKIATSMGVPALLQEQNSYPGITNKILAKKVQKICVAYDGMEQFFPKEKIIFTGNPVRQDIVDLSNKRAKGLEQFGLSADKKVVLVIGGSLGARTINESIEAGLEEMVNNNIQLLWQTGLGYVDKATKSVKKYAEKGIVTMPFIATMDLAYAVADVVVSRAGALSVSELCLTEKPSILVPSPNVAEDHQTKNAMALVNQKAAILVKDVDAKTALIPALLNLLNNTTLQQELKSNIKQLAKPNAAEVIADEVVKLAKL